MGTCASTAAVGQTSAPVHTLQPQSTSRSAKDPQVTEAQNTDCCVKPLNLLPHMASTLSSRDRPFDNYNPNVWASTRASNPQLEAHPEDISGTSGQTPTFIDADLASPMAGDDVSGEFDHVTWDLPKRSPSVAMLRRLSAKRSQSITSESRLEELTFDEPASAERQAKAVSRRKSISALKQRVSNAHRDVPARLSQITVRTDSESMDDYLERVFRILDSTGSQSITEEQFTQILDDGTGVDESVRQLFNLADGDRKGSITLDEFQRFFRHAEDNDEFFLGDRDTASHAGSVDEDGVDDERNSRRRSSVMGASRLQTSSTLYLSTCTAVTDPGHRGLRDIKVRTMPSQSERVKCVALSEDGKLFAVTHRHDKVVHLYSTTSGNEVRRLVGHGDSLLGIAFSPDRKYVATAARDKLLLLWDRTVGLECHCVEHPAIVTCVCFSFDGRFLYTGCQDNVVRRFSAPKSRLRANTAEFQGMESGVIVALAAQRTRSDIVVFSRSSSTEAYVADAESLQLMALLNGHFSLVWQCSFSSNDERFLTCCEVKVLVWDTTTFASVACFDAQTLGPTLAPECGAVLWTTAVFGPEHLPNLVFAFNSAGQLLVLDDEMKQPKKMVMDLTLRSSVYAAAPPSGDTMLCGDDFGNVYQLTIV